MAYILKNGQNEDDEQAPSNGLGQPVQLSGQNSVMTGIGSNSSNPTAANVPKRAATSGTGFTNISQYLDQNKIQAQGLASQVGDYVKGQGDSARSTLDEAQTSFNNKVDQNTVKYNQEQAQQAAQNSARFVQDNSNVDYFKKMRDANYTGPASFESDSENYLAASNAVNNATKLAKNVQTEAGRKDVLGEIQSGRGVSAGVNTFNNLLLAGEPARNIIQESSQSINDLEGRLTSASEAAKARAAGAKLETDATRNAIQSQFGGEGTDSVSTFKKQLQNNAQNYITNTDSLTQSAVQKFQQNKALNSDELRVLGMTQQQYNQLLAQNNYLKSNYKQGQFGNLANPSYLAYKNAGAEYNVDNVTSAEEYARLQALSQLMDEDTSGFIADPSKLGTANDDLVDFNYDALSKNVQSTLNNQTAARQAQRTAAQNELKAAEENMHNARGNIAVGGGGMGASMILKKAQERLDRARNTFNQYGSEAQNNVDFRAIQALLSKYNKGEY